MPEAPSSHTRTLTMKAALGNLAGGPPFRWASIAEGLDGEVWPEITPSFRIGSDETVFTIGSCFARNIETHLATLGCRVPMLDFRLPASEWHGPPTTALNKFSPGAFLQSLTWTEAVQEDGGRVSWEHCAPLAIDCGGGQVFDLELASQTTVSRERFLERRQQIQVFREAFSADAVMMTPGLVEAWRDLETGIWIQGPASRRVLSRPERFRLEVVGHEQALGDLLAAIDIVRRHNPAAKIVLKSSLVAHASSSVGLVRTEHPSLAIGMEAVHRRDRALERLDHLEHRDLARRAREPVAAMRAAHRAHQPGLA